MDLKTYQTAALKTALPSALSPAYLVPGAIGELGELFGQKAKAHRDYWDADRLQQQLISEYGDVAWMTAVLLSTFDLDAVEYQYGTPTDPQAALLDAAQTLYAAYSDPNEPTWLDDAACALWHTLAVHCESVTGVSFDRVLQYNVVKLADRARRSVISGAGDER